LPAQIILTEPFGQLPNANQEENTMFAKVAFGMAVVLATASGALATTRTSGVAPTHDPRSVYTPYGGYVGTDPDVNIRFELNRDWAHGRY
jgi:hypothetical protein